MPTYPLTHLPTHPLRQLLTGRPLKPAGSVNWPALAGEALAWGLGPLLYDAIRRAPPPLPPECLAALQAAHRRSAARNSLLLRELAAVLAVLDRAGIPAILLKGAALAPVVYDNIAQRPMRDLDLLLPLDRVATAVHHLAPLGYTTAQPFVTGRYRSLLTHDWPLRRDTSPVIYLELHSRLIDNPYYHGRPPYAGLWRRSAVAPFAGGAARRLAPADQILHLSAHNVHHHQGRYWRAGLDIERLLAHEGLAVDWEQLLDSAGRHHLRLAVAQTLSQAAAHWGAAVPAELLERLAAERPSRRERFFVAAGRRRHGPALLRLAATPGLRPRLAYGWGLLFPGRDYLAARYQAAPAGWLLPTHLRRLGQIARRGVRAVWPPRRPR